MVTRILFKTGTKKLRKMSFACLLLAGLFSYATTQAFAASRETSIIMDPTSPERVLIFPTDLSIGFLQIVPRALSKAPGGMQKKMTLQARGKIVIPKNTFVTLEANKEFFKNPTVLAKFAPNSLDGIELRMLSMDDNEDDFCDRAIPAITHLKGLVVLNIDKSEVSDVGLKKIGGLSNLQSISGFLTPVRGEFLKETTGLKKLRVLELDSVGLKEEYFQYLTQYPSLVCIRFAHAHVSDKGVQTLSKCTKIEDLDISKNPAIDDQAMPFVKNMKTLRYLNLFDTAVTPQGLLSLKDLKLVKLTLPKRVYPEKVMAQIKTAFPGTQVVARFGEGKMDDETKAIFSPMTR